MKALNQQNPPQVSQQSMAERAASLEKENASLQAQIESLISAGHTNQEIQRKFFSLELHCLQSASYSTLVNRLLNELPQHLNLDHVELYILDPRGDIRQLIKEIYGGLTFANLHYEFSESELSAITCHNLKVNLVQKPSTIGMLFQNKRKTVRSAAVLPLVRDGQLIGSLHLGSEDESRFAARLGTDFLQHLASILAICVENALTQERFKHLSLVDMLTRTKNRRYFIQTMTREIARSSRSGEPISCLFIDLDNFKKINDQRGHLTGDKALVEVAETITPLLRSSDVLARFGGEEFTILLPATELDAALEIAERIRKQVAQLHLKDEKGKYFGLTVSIGVSTWRPVPDHFQTPESVQNQLINQADMGVYQAKADGRNCVRIAC